MRPPLFVAVVVGAGSAFGFVCIRHQEIIVIFTKTTMMKILINKGMTMRTYKVVELVGCPLPQVIVELH